MQLTKNQKIGIGVAVVLAGIGLGGALYFYNKSKEEREGSGDGGSAGGSAGGGVGGAGQADFNQKFNQIADYASGALVDGIRAGRITGSSADGEDRVFIQIKNTTPQRLALIRAKIQSYKNNPSQVARFKNLFESEPHKPHTIVLREGIGDAIPGTIFSH